MELSLYIPDVTRKLESNFETNAALSCKRKKTQVVSSLQTSCNKSVHKLSDNKFLLSSVRTAYSAIYEKENRANSANSPRIELIVRIVCEYSLNSCSGNSRNTHWIVRMLFPLFSDYTLSIHSIRWLFPIYADYPHYSPFINYPAYS